MYSFRFRFHADHTLQIAPDEPDLELHRDESEHVTMSTWQFNTKDEQSTFESVVEGSGYASYQDATDACRKWYSALRLGLAELHMGADFFVNNSSEEDWEIEPTREAEEYGTGRRVIENEKRQLVFLTEPAAIIWEEALSVTPGRGWPAAKVLEAVTGIAEAGVVLSPGLDLACDFFGRSFGLGRHEARFVMLVTAVEAMFDQRPRAQNIREAVTLLVKHLKQLDLSVAERSALGSQVGLLKNESKKEAGVRLVKEHVDDFAYIRRTGEEEGPAEFFDNCYALRSRIVHASPTPDDKEDARSRVPMLEVLVARLIVRLAISR